MGYVQDLRDVFVERVISNSTDKMPDGMFVAGYTRFVEPNLLEMDDGQRIRAGKVIIATGSRPIVPAAWEPFRDRIITTDDFFELEELPTSIAVVGLGVIGLEIGQSLHRLGCKVVGIDMQEAVGGLTDPVAIKSAVDIIGGEMELWLGQGAQISEGSNGRLRVSAGDNTIEVERVLASMGRQPNVEKLGPMRSVYLWTSAVPLFDPSTMQVGDLPLFLAGDVTGERPLLHEAGDEGRIAGQNAVSDTVSAYRRKTPLNITFATPTSCRWGSCYAASTSTDRQSAKSRWHRWAAPSSWPKTKGVIRVYADKPAEPCWVRKWSASRRKPRAPARLEHPAGPHGR